jgi:hypothetical protein
MKNGPRFSPGVERGFCPEGRNHRGLSIIPNGNKRRPPPEQFASVKPLKKVAAVDSSSLFFECVLPCHDRDAKDMDRDAGILLSRTMSMEPWRGIGGYPDTGTLSETIPSLFTRILWITQGFLIFLFIYCFKNM